MKKIILYYLLVVASFCVTAQSPSLVNKPPALQIIKEADLKKDIYDLAGPHFNGRSAGTIDELKASMWLATKFSQIGLTPGGDDGTYFQFFNTWRNRIATNSWITINDHRLQLWKDVAISQMAEKDIDTSVLYLGNAAEIDFSHIDVKGKIVSLEATTRGISLDISLPTWRYSRLMMTRYGTQLINKGAVGIIFIADEYGERCWADATENFKRGNYDIEGGPNAIVTSEVPVIWVHANMKPVLTQDNVKLKARIIVERFEYPSVNIIGMLKGTNNNLSNEFLLYSGHQDAHGIRNVIKGDSIYYGADDNASVDVAMLAIARAFKKNPGKRSVIFVIHGAEERGLLGSRWYVAHSTIPGKKIIAVLNGDMIGRNNPDSASLLGVQPPHRNSTELVDMALAANNEGPQFKLDTSWDRPTHPEGWYFRSDHLPYARAGIPALMFTTLIHPDYHTPQDRADGIDIPKLKRMTEWLYRTGWKVVNAPRAPALEKNFKLER